MPADDAELPGWADLRALINISAAAADSVEESRVVPATVAYTTAGQNVAAPGSGRPQGQQQPQHQQQRDERQRALLPVGQKVLQPPVKANAVTTSEGPEEVATSAGKQPAKRWFLF